jgi:S-adenosylmethionine synthetase
MSKLKNNHVFTSESVSEGHPDKVCDQVSDAILDACLAEDPSSKVACETAVTTNFLINIGEITCRGWDAIDPEAIARQVVKEIGYDRDELLFCCDTFDYECRIHPQSCDIAQGVYEGQGLFKEQGAGDQGMMFGYATNETDVLMPAPITYAHRLVQRQSEIRKSGVLPWLRPDAKSQVSLQYEGGRVTGIDAVVLSTQHDPDIDYDHLREAVMEMTRSHIRMFGSEGRA